MNMIGIAFRLIGQVMRHPATHAVLNHALRVATAEMVRHIQRKTRGRSTRISYS